ncbi:hypothetical protein AAG906_000348 [Vitis piasezkii]
MNDLRTGFLERHRKRLYEAIDIVPSPAKRVCPKNPQEDPAAKPDVAGPSAAAVVRPDTGTPSNASATEKARGTKGGPDVAVSEEAPDEKSSPTPAAPLSWEEMMEMLKGVSCFTDAEAPSTKMSDFFPLTKLVSVNMGGDIPTFVKARLFFGTPESVIVAGIRYMMRTREQLFKRLEVAKAMQAFISHHSGDIEEMSLNLGGSSQGGEAGEFSAQEGDGRTPGQSRGSKEGNGGAANGLGCSKEGDGG